MLTVYDANNWARRQLEAGASIRACVTHLAHSPAPTVVVWDGPRGNARRREDYPAYKAKRKQLPEDMSEAFKFIRELLEFTPVLQIRVPDYEGDDVIAHLAKKTCERILLYSQDKDLLGFDNIEFSESLKEPCSKQCLRLYKTLVGDSSDNIPGLKGFGKKAWEKLDPFDRVTLLSCFRNVKYDWKLKDQKLQERIDADLENLKIYWKIIGFYEIPDDLINKYTKLGTNNPAALNARLAEFLQ